MKNGLYTTAAGMLTALERLNVISNNLANISTSGYKSDIPFEQAIKFLMEGPYPGKDQPILGGTALDTSNGNIKMTSRKLDLAFEGPGFFVIQGPEQKELYTRCGSFNLNSSRQVVTAEGFNVLDKFNKPITLFGNEFYFTPKGDLYIDGNYYTTLKTINIPDRNNLEKIGNQYFKVKDGAPAPQVMENPGLVVGAIEGSNVEMIEELVSLISVQRSFEFQQRTLDTILSDILRKTISELPKPV